MQKMWKEREEFFEPESFGAAGSKAAGFSHIGSHSPPVEDEIEVPEKLPAKGIKLNHKRKWKEGEKSFELESFGAAGFSHIGSRSPALEDEKEEREKLLAEGIKLNHERKRKEGENSALSSAGAAGSSGFQPVQAGSSAIGSSGFQPVPAGSSRLRPATAGSGHTGSHSSAISDTSPPITTASSTARVAGVPPFEFVDWPQSQFPSCTLPQITPHARDLILDQYETAPSVLQRTFVSTNIVPGQTYFELDISRVTPSLIQIVEDDDLEPKVAPEDFLRALQPFSLEKRQQLFSIAKINDPKNPARKYTPEGEPAYGLFALKSVKVGTLLPYSGVVHTYFDWENEVHANDHMQNYAVSLRSTASWVGAKKGDVALILDGYSVRSMACYINDYRDLQFTENKQKRKSERIPNCKLVEVLLDGMPYVFVVITVELLKNEELLLDYGLDSYWDIAKRNMMAQKKFLNMKKLLTSLRKEKSQLKKEIEDLKKLLAVKCPQCLAKAPAQKMSNINPLRQRQRCPPVRRPVNRVTKMTKGSTAGVTTTTTNEAFALFKGMAAPSEGSNTGATWTTEAVSVPAEPVPILTEPISVPAEAVPVSTEAVFVPTEAASVPIEAVSIPTKAVSCSREAVCSPTEAVLSSSSSLQIPLRQKARKGPGRPRKQKDNQWWPLADCLNPFATKAGLPAADLSHLGQDYIFPATTAAIQSTRLERRLRRGQPQRVAVVHETDRLTDPLTANGSNAIHVHSLSAHPTTTASDSDSDRAAPEDRPAGADERHLSFAADDCNTIHIHSLRTHPTTTTSDSDRAALEDRPAGVDQPSLSGVDGGNLGAGTSSFTMSDNVSIAVADASETGDQYDLDIVLNPRPTSLVDLGASAATVACDIVAVGANEHQDLSKILGTNCAKLDGQPTTTSHVLTPTVARPSLVASGDSDSDTAPVSSGLPRSRFLASHGGDSDSDAVAAPVSSGPSRSGFPALHVPTPTVARCGLVAGGRSDSDSDTVAAPMSSGPPHSRFPASHVPSPTLCVGVDSPDRQARGVMKTEPTSLNQKAVPPSAQAATGPSQSQLRALDAINPEPTSLAQKDVPFGPQAATGPSQSQLPDLDTINPEPTSLAQKDVPFGAKAATGPSRTHLPHFDAVKPEPSSLAQKQVLSCAQAATGPSQKPQYRESVHPNDVGTSQCQVRDLDDCTMDLETIARAQKDVTRSAQAAVGPSRKQCVAFRCVLRRPTRNKLGVKGPGRFLYKERLTDDVGRSQCDNRTSDVVEVGATSLAQKGSPRGAQSDTEQPPQQHSQEFGFKKPVQPLHQERLTDDVGPSQCDRRDSDVMNTSTPLSCKSFRLGGERLHRYVQGEGEDLDDCLIIDVNEFSKAMQKKGERREG